MMTATMNPIWRPGWTSRDGWSLTRPYDVTVPFGAALYRAYEKRLQAFPDALQLRMRRDISGLISAIKTSAVLHKAQRDRDAKGRIVATIDDYRHAHEAFDEGVSSLYGVKTRKEIIAVVRAVEEMGATDRREPEGHGRRAKAEARHQFEQHRQRPSHGGGGAPRP